MLGPDHDDDEPDDRRRRDGVTMAVGSQQSLALDPHEIVGNDPFGYPETRAARTARLMAQGTSSYAAFDMHGRPL